MGSCNFFTACGGCCCVFGLIIVIVAIVLPLVLTDMTQALMKAGIETSMKIDKESYFKGDKHPKESNWAEVAKGDKDLKWSEYSIFHLTNAPDMFTGAKPKVEKVTYKLYSHSDCYDPVWGSGDEYVDYTCWGNMTIHPDQKDDFENTYRTFLNPQLSIGVWQFAGSDKHLMPAIANKGCEGEGLSKSFLELVPKQLGGQTANLYMLFWMDVMVNKLQKGAAGVAELMGYWVMDPADASASNPTLKMMLEAVPVPQIQALAPLAQGFELNSNPNVKGTLGMVGGITVADVTWMFTEKNPFGLDTEANAWLPFLICLGSAQAAALTTCFDDGAKTAVADAIALKLGGANQLGRVKTIAVGTWLVTNLFDPSGALYRKVVFMVIQAKLAEGAADANNGAHNQAILAHAAGEMSNADPSDYTDLGCLQFGTSAISLLMGLGASVKPNPDPEIAALAYADKKKMLMTIAQAKAFLKAIVTQGNVLQIVYGVRQLQGTCVPPANVESGMLVYCGTSFLNTILLNSIGARTNNPNVDMTVIDKFLSEHVPMKFVVPVMLGMEACADGSVKPKCVNSNGARANDGNGFTGIMRGHLGQSFYNGISGLFVNITANMLLKGWVDPVVAQIDPNAPEYLGLLGREFETEAASKQYNLDNGYNADNITKFLSSKGQMRRYSRYSGNDDITKAYAQRHWKFIHEFETRADRGDACDTSFGKSHMGYNSWGLSPVDWTFTSAISGEVNLGAQGPFTSEMKVDHCRVWKANEKIDEKGASSFKNTNAGFTYTETNAENMKKKALPFTKRNVWNSGLARNIEFVDAGEEDIKGVRTIKFEPAAGFMQGQGNNANNEQYRMTEGDGIIPLYYLTGNSQTVSYAGWLGSGATTKATQNRQCFDLTESGIASTFAEPDAGVARFNIEPITGRTMAGFSKFLASVKLSKTIFGMMAPEMWSNCDEIFWPVMEWGGVEEPTDEQADMFKGLIYGTLDMLNGLGGGVMGGGLAGGIIIILASLGCIFFGVKKGQQPPNQQGQQMGASQA